MLQSMNCIRLGQVLMDENRQFFILCNNCHSDIQNLAEFRRHLEECEGLENIFREDQTFKYSSDKGTQLLGKTAKGIKEFLIYDYTDVDVQLSENEKNFIDLINIEEELLDPKWYSDTCPQESILVPQKSSKQYDVLVEEVTPFVQFKENLKSKNTIAAKTIVNATNAVPKLKAKPTVKRKLAITKVQNSFTHPQPHCKSSLQTSSKSFHVDAPYQVPIYKRHRPENGTTSNVSISNIANQTQAFSTATQTLALTALAPCSDISSVSPSDIPGPSPQPAKEKQTAKILNKLQNLGLQIKRTQSYTVPSIDVCKKPDDKTLEILLKLQSKGMKVKVLNKQTAPATTNYLNTPTAMSANYVKTKSSQSSTSIKANMNKNIVIRKVN